jgi:hypothetical protein
LIRIGEQERKVNTKRKDRRNIHTERRNEGISIHNDQEIRNINTRRGDGISTEAGS